MTRKRVRVPPRSWSLHVVLLVLAVGGVALALRGGAERRDAGSWFVYEEPPRRFARRPRPAVLTPDRPPYPTAAPVPRGAGGSPPPVPGAETGREEPMRPYVYPITMTSEGTPDLRTPANTPGYVPEPMVTSEQRAHEIFGSVRHFLLVRYNMELSRQPVFHLVEGDDSSVLGRGQHARVVSRPATHEVYVRAGLEGDDFLARATEMYAICWYNERAWESNPRDRCGFAMWCAYKVLYDRGSRVLAATFQDGSFTADRDPVCADGVRFFTELERTGGERGVFGYILTRHGPDAPQ